jgi:hypothetical protein
MNTNTNAGRTSMSRRRAVPAVAIVALAIGLGACQTPPDGAAAPESPVIPHAQVPAGVDMWRPPDRITEQLARQATAPKTHFGSWTDRITAQIQYEASLTVNSADAISEELKHLPADRIVERLHRVHAGMRLE